MRFHCVLLTTVALNGLANAAAMSPIGENNYSITGSALGLDSTIRPVEISIPNDDLNAEVQAAGMLGWVKNGKTKTINFVKILKKVLENIRKIEEIKNDQNRNKWKEENDEKEDDVRNGDESEEEDEEQEEGGEKKGLVSKAKGWFRKGSSLVRRDLVEDLLVKVFVSLKRSGLINSIIKMSLTDDEVREGVVDIAADLLERDVIPFEDIFVALKDSGLAIDVIKFSLTDEKTRGGVVALIRELLPQLIADGSFKPKDLIPTPPKVSSR